jgi:hypothetical protein
VCVSTIRGSAPAGVLVAASPGHVCNKGVVPAR